MARNLTIFLTLFIIILEAGAQNPPVESVVKIKRATDEIVLDGKLEEVSWETADVAKDFYLAYPVDTTFATSQTEVRLSFNDQFLYVGVVCHDPTPGEYIVESLKRDFIWPSTENVSLHIDPINNRTNGFAYN